MPQYSVYICYRFSSAFLAVFFSPLPNCFSFPHFFPLRPSSNDDYFLFFHFK